MAELLEEWLLFQNIIARNYLQHREVIRTLYGWARDHGRNRMRILDLGCGDAYTVKKAFKGINEVQYYGIDLSSHSLNIGRSNFAANDWSVELLEGDITKMIQQLHGPFDFVMAGYSLHHLNKSQQANVLDQIRLVLSPMGTLIIYDLMPRKGEKTSSFKQRLLEDAASGWNLLESEQMSYFKQHIEECAQPLDQGTWQTLANASSLGKAELIYRDEAEHMGMLKF